MATVIKNRTKRAASTTMPTSKPNVGTPGGALKANATPTAKPATSTPIRPSAPMSLAPRGSMMQTVKRALDAKPPHADFIASLFEKKAVDAARNPAARTDELLNMNTTGGAFADYLAPGTWGGTRAGKAQQLAESMGEEPSFNVRHPGTSQLLSSLVGTAGGGLLGAGLGAGIGALTGNDNMGAGAGIGTAVGALGGAVGGPLYAAHRRRKEMGGITDRFQSRLESGGKITPKKPEFGWLATLLAPLRGPHRAGQADTYEALSRNAAPSSDTLRNTGYTAGMLPYVGPMVGLPMSYGQNIGAKLKADRVGKRQPAAPAEEEPQTERAKAAAWVEKFAFGGMAEPKMLPPPTTGAPPPPSAPGGPASASPALPAAAGQPQPMGQQPAPPPAAPQPPAPPPGGAGGVLPPQGQQPAAPPAAGAAGAPPAAGQGAPPAPPPQPGDPAAAGGAPPAGGEFPPLTDGAPAAPAQPAGHNDPGLSLLTQGPKQPEGLFDGMDHDGQIAPPVPGMFSGTGDVPQTQPSSAADPMLLKRSAASLHNFITPPSKSALAFGEKMAMAPVSSVSPPKLPAAPAAKPTPVPQLNIPSPGAPQTPKYEGPPLAGSATPDQMPNLLSRTLQAPSLAEQFGQEQATAAYNKQQQLQRANAILKPPGSPAEIAESIVRAKQPGSLPKQPVSPLAQQQ